MCTDTPSPGSCPGAGSGPGAPRGARGHSTGWGLPPPFVTFWVSKPGCTGTSAAARSTQSSASARQGSAAVILTEGWVRAGEAAGTRLLPHPPLYPHRWQHSPAAFMQQVTQEQGSLVPVLGDSAGPFPPIVQSWMNAALCRTQPRAVGEQVMPQSCVWGEGQGCLPVPCCWLLTAGPRAWQCQGRSHLNEEGSSPGLSYSPVSPRRACGFPGCRQQAQALLLVQIQAHGRNTMEVVGTEPHPELTANTSSPLPLWDSPQDDPADKGGG